MWKKVLILLIGLVGTFSVAYAYNMDMQAAKADTGYLAIGDTFYFGQYDIDGDGKNENIEWYVSGETTLKNGKRIGVATISGGLHVSGLAWNQHASFDPTKKNYALAEPWCFIDETNGDTCFTNAFEGGLVGAWFYRNTDILKTNGLDPRPITDGGFYTVFMNNLPNFLNSTDTDEKTLRGKWLYRTGFGQSVTSSDFIDYGYYVEDMNLNLMQIEIPSYKHIYYFKTTPTRFSLDYNIMLYCRDFAVNKEPAVILRDGATTYAYIHQSYATVEAAPVMYFANDSFILNITVEEGLKERTPTVAKDALIGTLSIESVEKGNYAISLAEDHSFPAGAMDQDYERIPTDAKFLNDNLTLNVIDEVNGIATLRANANLTAGTYFIKVNVIDNSITSSSEKTFFYKIVIDENASLSSITVHSKTDLEYSKNVNRSDIVASFSSVGGDEPISYRLISDTTVSGHEHDDKKFMISGTDILVNEDELLAGSYYFKLNAIDKNGIPDGGIISETVIITVRKTSATVSFDLSEQTELKIGAASITEGITSSNTDLKLGGYVPSYTLSGGVTGTGLNAVVNGSDIHKFDLSVGAASSSALPTTFTLTVNTPETDNYLSASATKQIYVFKDLSNLVWSPTKLSYATDDVTNGSIVGTLKAEGGVAPYTYALVPSSDPNYNAVDGANNNDFAIASTPVALGSTQDVKTSITLGAGKYHIQFMVTDSKGNTYYKKASITVNAKTQESFDFKDISGGKNITSKTIYFDDINEKLIAEGGSTTASPVYSLAPNDKQPSDIDDASEYADIDPISGIITPKKIGTIKVQAEKAGDSSYSAATVYMDLTIKAAKQNITFTNTDDPHKIKLGDTSIKEIASGVLTSNGSKESGIGGITYESMNGSIVTIGETTGDITTNAIGTVDIKATLNKKGTTDYNDNYETATVTKKLYIYKGMEVTWNPEFKNLQVGNTAIANGKAGNITYKENEGNVKFIISTETDSKNADASLFTVDNLGNVKLVSAISASELKEHGNPYKIMVDVKDDNGTQTLELEISIDAAENDFYFVDAEDGSTKITEITKKYATSGTFDLATFASNGKPVTYKIKDGENTDVIEIVDASVKIKKVGGPIIVEASVEAGNGYQAKTISIPITITKGQLKIAFDNVKDTFVEYKAGASSSESATLTPTGGIKYEVLPASKEVCEIDAVGLVTALQAGTCVIQASSIDANFETAKTTKKVTFYTGVTAAFTQDKIPQADHDANKGTLLGSVEINGGTEDAEYKYSISDSSDIKNADAALFEIDPTYGNINLKQKITVTDLLGKPYDTTEKAYLLYMIVNVLDEKTGATTPVECAVNIKGAKLSVLKFKDEVGGKISRVYAKDDTFILGLNGNIGGGTPKYTYVSGPTDVIDTTIKGNSVKVLNANDYKNDSTPVMVQASIPAKGGYEETAIEVEVEITQAEQTEFDFVSKPIPMLQESSTTPVFKGTETDGKITMISADTSKITVEDDTLRSGKDKGTVTIYATKKGNRNYKDKTVSAQVMIDDKPAYDFVISVPTATYGDSNKQAEIAVSKPPTSGGTLTQTWTSSDESVATVDKDGKITILSAGKTTITCVQTSDKDATVKASAIFTVKPKAITVTIGDATKKVGESVPKFSATVDTAELVVGDAIGQPTITCTDEERIVDETTKAGTYAIEGSYEKGSYPNYVITVVSGTLTITQDASDPTWYELEGDISANTLNSTAWHKEDVRVKLIPSISGSYNEISLDKTLWNTTYILVNQEGITTSDVYFQNDTSHALATSQPTTIKIDKTKPEINKMDGVEIKQNEISKLLNKLTFGTFFKPKQEITIEAKDIIPSGVSDVSGITSVDYEIYELDNTTGLPTSTTPDTTGTETLDSEGKAVFKINDVGFYRVCAITTDKAGNISNKKCADLNFKNIDVDVDGDGTLDFNDANKDGCPDLNIKWIDPKDNTKWVIINGDRNNDGVPDINIDSNGDGKADLNVDTDNDGKPDLNLVMSTKAEWKPTKCVVQDIRKGIMEEYCTGTDAKAQINVDTTGNGIPDINIDTKGDFKPHYNVTKAGSNKPYLNIGPVHSTWKPDEDYKSGDFIYDSIGKHKPLTNIDTNNDGKPDINIDFDGNGTADINIDLSGDGIPDIDIDGDGDGIPDYNLDPDEDGNPTKNNIVIETWEPIFIKEKDGLEFGTMEIKNNEKLEDDGIIVEKTDGGVFLPNFALKVDDITISAGKEIKDALAEHSDEKVIQGIYQVSLRDNGVEIQPDGSIKVRIPVRSDLKNPSILMQQKDGNYVAKNAVIEDGYYVFETNHLGIISVISDVEDDPTPDIPEEDKPKEPSMVLPGTDSGGSMDTPTTDVKGTYTAKNDLGGAITGDDTSIVGQSLMVLGSLMIVLYLLRNKLIK